nr:hypothetical protein B0A51_11626 [Rachicladosporium sp. CCFEE 5018]
MKLLQSQDTEENLRKKQAPKFMDLPPEIRVHIYELAMSKEHVEHGVETPAVLRVSRQVHAEALPIYYSTAAVVLEFLVYENNVVPVIAAWKTRQLWKMIYERGMLGRIRHLLIRFQYSQAGGTDWSITCHVDMALNGRDYYELDFDESQLSFGRRQIPSPSDSALRANLDEAIDQVMQKVMARASEEIWLRWDLLVWLRQLTKTSLDDDLLRDHAAQHTMAAQRDIKVESTVTIPTAPRNNNAIALRATNMTTTSERPFAGRIGGNQGFTVSDDSAESRKILEEQPDAAPLPNLRASVHLSGFLVCENWKMAAIEGLGTCLLTFTLGAGSSALTRSKASDVAVGAYAALLNTVGLSLFVFAAGPASGGHLNPSITLATFFAGLSTLPRSVLYIVAQAIGAIVGAYWLRLGLGDAYFPMGVIPGCTVDPSLVSPGELFVLEYMFGLSLVFLAFGVGLDPRQGKVFGPSFSPILVGATLGLVTLAGAFVKPGYTGPSFNPARCLGLMVAKGNMQYHYVHWLGPVAATMMNGIFYHAAPPWVRGRPLREHGDDMIQRALP